MQGERWQSRGLVWIRLAVFAPLVAGGATACGDSKRDDRGVAETGAAAGSGGVSAGAGGRAGSGSGGSLGGAAGKGGSAGTSTAGGTGGDSSAGKGGTTGGVAMSGGSAGRTAGGAAGTETSGGMAGDGEGGSSNDGACPAEAVGAWALGDDNLFVVIESDCSVSNFCSVAEGIHTTGNVTHSVMLLSSVGGQPIAFAYTLSGDTLTLIDAGPGPAPVDLPLSRSEDPLPATCPPPAAPPRTGAVGVRCSVEGDCALGLDCTGRFFEERAICTMPCSGSCPDGAECVAGVLDYNSQPLEPYCFQRCQVSADCVPYGSECDAYESGGDRHCF